MTAAEKMKRAQAEAARQEVCKGPRLRLSRRRNLNRVARVVYGWPRYGRLHHRSKEVLRAGAQGQPMTPAETWRRLTRRKRKTVMRFLHGAHIECCRSDYADEYDARHAVVVAIAVLTAAGRKRRKV